MNDLCGACCAGTSAAEGQECIERDLGDSECSGEVREYRSRSGCTIAARCGGHQTLHDQRIDAVEAGLDQRYPGWNSPGSPPPSDFDPTYAGERWDDED